MLITVLHMLSGDSRCESLCSVVSWHSCLTWPVHCHLSILIYHLSLLFVFLMFCTIGRFLHVTSGMILWDARWILSTDTSHLSQKMYSSEFLSRSSAVPPYFQHTNNSTTQDWGPNSVRWCAVASRQWMNTLKSLNINGKES